jgi:protein MPE1
MAAMFQAQTQNWEEAQEKMSQLVLPIAGFCLYVVQNLMMNVFFFSSPTCLIETVPRVSIPILEGLASLAVENRILPLYLIRFRTTGLCHLAMFVIDAERKVCPYQIYLIKIDTFYQGHWIQDCPTNNDREFDNRPRIKRTTGIPRSMLKAVETPNNGELTQGVMVTPEGGYVVAQPDLYVHLAISILIYGY